MSATATVAVAWLVPGVPAAPAETVPNTAAGWRQVARRARQVGAEPAAARLVMEATGSYRVGAATALPDAGWAVAAVLAQYGRDLAPARWTPPPAEVQQRQLLLRQRDDLVAMRPQTRNRRHALRQLPGVPPEALAPLEAVLARRAAAATAARRNPTFRAFYLRLLASGKPKVAALTAVARKLLVVLVTLLQHRRTFDPDWAARHPPRQP